jgi:hypothetical protein
MLVRKYGDAADRQVEKDTICGNQVRIRFLRNKYEHAPQMVARNTDSDPLLLFDMTRESPVRIRPTLAGEVRPQVHQ